MGHRIAVMIDDHVWLQLQKVPQGERSKLVSEAVSKELQCRSRGTVAAEMDRLRKMYHRARASAEELVRAARDSH